MSQTPYASEGQLKKVSEILGNLADTPLESWTREAQLGNLNLVDCSSQLVSIGDIAREVRSLPWKKMNKSVVQKLEQGLTAFQSAINGLARFDLGVPNPPHHRQQIVAQFLSAFETAYDSFLPLLTYLRTEEYRQDDSRSIRNEAQREVENAIALLRDTVKSTERSASEIETILESARKATQQVGISKYSTVFAKQSDRYRNIAWVWLGVSTLLASIAVFLAFQMATLLAKSHKSLSGADSFEASVRADSSDFSLVTATYDWQVVGLRVFLLSMLVYGTVWTTRNYSSHRHNCVLNRHRQNALDTFEAFVNSTKDDEIRNAVLLQATHCIFDHQHTGYLGKQGPLEAKTIFTEVIDRGLRGSPKGSD